MYGCRNCRFFQQYQSLNYYEPNDIDCSVGEYATGAWSDWCEWCDFDEPLCNKYEYDYRKEMY